MIDEIIDLLAQRCLILVHGSSGAGKSSFVRAGVIPALGRAVISLPTHPGLKDGELDQICDAVRALRR
jgi:tRNA A37 threonylcarbamoyladenosine biosynthesis protein TsaE